MHTTKGYQIMHKVLNVLVVDVNYSADATNAEVIIAISYFESCQPILQYEKKQFANYSWVVSVQKA